MCADEINQAASVKALNIVQSTIEPSSNCLFISQSVKGFEFESCGPGDFFTLD